MAEAEQLPQDHAALRSPRDAALQMRGIGIHSRHIWRCSLAPAPANARVSEACEKWRTRPFVFGRSQLA